MKTDSWPCDHLELGSGKQLGFMGLGSDILLAIFLSIFIDYFLEGQCKWTWCQHEYLFNVNLLPNEKKGGKNWEVGSVRCIRWKIHYFLQCSFSNGLSDIYPIWCYLAICILSLNGFVFCLITFIWNIKDRFRHILVTASNAKASSSSLWIEASILIFISLTGCLLYGIRHTANGKRQTYSSVISCKSKLNRFQVIGWSKNETHWQMCASFEFDLCFFSHWKYSENVICEMKRVESCWNSRWIINLMRQKFKFVAHILIYCAD